MSSRFLINKIAKYIPVKGGHTEEKVFHLSNLSFLAIRDSIIGMGTILEEDFDSNTYVLSVPSGIRNWNNAIVAIQLSGDTVSILGYANEGLINQYSAKKAIKAVCLKLTK